MVLLSKLLDKYLKVFLDNKQSFITHRTFISSKLGCRNILLCLLHVDNDQSNHILKLVLLMFVKKYFFKNYLKNVPTTFKY